MRKDDLMKYYEPLMHGYSVLEVDAERPYSISLGAATYGRLESETSAYNIKKDKHLAPAFKPAYSNTEKQQRLLRVIALCVVSNLCNFSLETPDPVQMQELIQLSSYSTEEWNHFANMLSYDIISCFYGKKRQPVGIMLYTSLFDFLCEDSKVLSQIQKKRRNTSSDQFYSRRFRNMVSYLHKNELLNFLTLGNYPIQSMNTIIESQPGTEQDTELLNRAAETYESAIKRYGVLACRWHIISGEVKELKRQGIQESDRLIEESRRQAAKTLRDKIKGNAKNQKPFLKTALPQVPDVFQPTFAASSLLNHTGPFGPGGGLIQDALSDTTDALEEKLQRLSDYEDAVIAKARSEKEAIVEQEVKYLREDFAPEIAESAFLAILSGDEIYKTEIGSYLFHLLGQNSCLAASSIFTPELEDEDDWDDIAFPGDNGKLENVVLGETDAAVYHPDELDGIATAVKYGAAVAEYADCHVVLPIAIRKSQVKAFKKMGCSDRKARDYAIIAATLRSTNWQDAMEIRPTQYFPDTSGKPSTVMPENNPAAPSSELASAREDRKEAQQQRKAAERESQTLRHELAKLRRELEQTKEQLERSNVLLELYENLDEEAREEPASGEEFQFPFETERKIVLYGGFHSFHLEILKLIPGLRIIPSASRIDVAPVRNADIVFIQINKTSHSNYWNICDAAKASAVPYYHLNYASPRRCAEEIVQRVREMDIVE